MPESSDSYTQEQQNAIRTARSLRDLGHPLETILSSAFIPESLRDFVRTEIRRDEIITLVPARSLVARRDRASWVDTLDRSSWYYWPTLRQFLIRTKGWDMAAVRSLDDSSDKILRELESPIESGSDIRGLVLGFVQSGKTANYTALVAKAADAGYRLIIVLAGIDNGLRRQTNIRLKQELVGYPDNRPGTTQMPPLGKQWHEFTKDSLDGDFQPGFATHAALQGSQPVLLVIKKNGQVLRRLLQWLDSAPAETLRVLPALIIDDEADQASIDTRGTYQREDEQPDPDYEPPSAINRLIRDLLQRFDRKAYVAYTATPFANILIPHDTSDPDVQNDLYPRDFIVDLPKPVGYFGAEEIFGGMDSAADDGGLDIIRDVPHDDIDLLHSGEMPATLETAIYDFVLAGAARAQRGKASAPATMLVHASHLIMMHDQLQTLVEERFNEIRDEWRYQRTHGIQARLQAHWETRFREVTRARCPMRDVGFEEIESHVGPFLEAVKVRQVNSATGEALNYELEPSLKAIAIGGNRLSRGLTLEGLLVSYFVRQSESYDTLLQMGRWFGFRNGYEDLTRIWTTTTLAGWFSDLAIVEHRLREDIKTYEDHALTPVQVGMRIWQHPVMQVTNPLKRRFTRDVVIEQSYSGQIEQTFKFPMHKPDVLALHAEKNLLAVREFIPVLGSPAEEFADENGPVWKNISPEHILQFLNTYQVDPEVSSFSLPLLCAYIQKLVASGELTRWSVAVRGRQSQDATLGTIDWGFASGPISQIERTRIGETNSLGIITSPGDEAVCLTTEEKNTVQEQLVVAKAQGKRISENKLAREQRDNTEGLLLLYPISRYSGYALTGGNRRHLYADANGALARDLVGMALSFPKSGQLQVVQASYLQGTCEWRPVE